MKKDKNIKSENSSNIKKLKFIITTIIIFLIATVCCYFIMPLINNINFGLDLQGGFEVLYEVSPLTEEDELTEDMLYLSLIHI